jgi:hypothetical protein
MQAIVADRSAGLSAMFAKLYEKQRTADHCVGRFLFLDAC